MRFRIAIPPVIREALLNLPSQEQDELAEKLDLLQKHPFMYQLWFRSRRFRRHRQFVVGNWRIFYRVVDDTIWIRGLWPAQLPLRLMKRGAQTPQ